MLSMKQGSIIKGWGYHWISLFIPCRVNITCSPNILMLPDSYEAQLSEYIQLSHKQCVQNLYWTMGSRGQVRSSVKRALQSTPEFLVVGWRFLVHDFDIKHAHNGPGKKSQLYLNVQITQAYNVKIDKFISTCHLVQRIRSIDAIELLIRPSGLAANYNVTKSRGSEFDSASRHYFFFFFFFGTGVSVIYPVHR